MAVGSQIGKLCGPAGRPGSRLVPGVGKQKAGNEEMEGLRQVAGGIQTMKRRERAGIEGRLA